MKKITLAVMLLAAAIAFTSCGNPAGSGAGNQNNTGSGDAGSGDSNTTTVTFDDCTTTIAGNEFVLSDGQWAHKSVWVINNNVTNTNEMFGSVTSGNITFTSGKGIYTFNLTDVMTADEISAFNQASQEEKRQKYKQITHADIPETATITITGTNVTIEVIATESTLAMTNSSFSLAGYSSVAEIKSNNGKTKFTFSYTSTYGSDTVVETHYLYKI